MTITSVLFDLDGTLLDYDLRVEFLPRYFKALGAYFAHLIPPDKLIKGIMMASDAIGENDGTVTNQEAFARVFYPYVNYDRSILEPMFMNFYRDIFPTLQYVAPPKPEAREVVVCAFNLGYRVVIATNPYFPEIAVQHRLVWAGVDGLPYHKITTYENSHYAKPDLRYFREIVEDIGCTPEEALVVGDEAMDMVARHLGCQTYLVNSAATHEQEIQPEPTYRGSLIELKTVLNRLRS